MHHSAMTNATLFFKTYAADRSKLSIAEIGSLDVNGSIRDAAPRDAAYLGLDFSPGKGVDIILDDPYVLPLADASQDIVVSSSCFEHAEMFWLTFNEIMRVLKPEGLFYLNAPSNGTFHRYPVDCWRFYPDAGGALVKWAHRCGYKTALLESYLSPQVKTEFNDFVAVFIRDVSCAARYPQRMLNQVSGFTNGTLLGQQELLQPYAFPEDKRKLALIEAVLNGKLTIPSKPSRTVEST